MLGHSGIQLDQKADINFKESNSQKPTLVKEKKEGKVLPSEIAPDDWSLDSEPAWGTAGKSAVIY